MDTVDIKQRLDVIRVKYKLEPSLNAVYVEGTNDVSILRWFFDKKNKKNIYVYHIDNVEIPAEAYERAGLMKGSNRNKVIVLSEELSRDFDKRKIKAKCIADADYDRYLNKCRSNYILEYTDYTSIEMYLFKKSLIDKFLTLTLRGFRLSCRSVMSELKKVVQRLFLIRLANEKLGWDMTWLDSKRFGRYLSWSAHSVNLDEDRFIRAYLMKNGRTRNLAEFKSVMDEFEQKLDSDPRHNMRGHDFTHLFFLLVKKFKRHRSGFKDLETFEGSLCGCLELVFIEGEPLFVKLRA